MLRVKAERQCKKESGQPDLIFCKLCIQLPTVVSPHLAFISSSFFNFDNPLGDFMLLTSFFSSLIFLLRFP